MKFNATTKSELKHFIFHCTPLHDATFDSFQYIKQEKVIAIKLYNSYEKEYVYLTFYGVRFVLSTDTDAWGNDESVNAFCLEEDYSLPYTLLKDASFSIIDMLYFAFQMFSSNEIYILCDSIDIARSEPENGTAP